MNEQFDFWLGKWDLTWVDNGRGHNSITKILDDQIIREKFTTLHDDEVSPFQGISVSTFNKSQNQWQQTWVDNQGNYLDFAGGFADGQMILSRDALLKGKRIQQRMVWQDIQPNSLEWQWQQSDDGGQTWQTQWHIHYKRKEEK
ncbi:MAG: DUF1579 domain-containing protein [Chloroflexi bacterium]|nr:DUF1579 domain-containing protein [Chloroflexota bacterium]